jgi:hypothetical protein
LLAERGEGWVLCTREDAVVMVKVKKSDEQVEWSGRWMILYTHTHTPGGRRTHFIRSILFACPL